MHRRHHIFIAMQHFIWLAAIWAFFLLCAAAWRSGSWRAAVPLFEGAMQLQAAGPSTRVEDEDEEQPETDWVPRRLPVPGPLVCAVAATAAVRLSVLFAVGY